MKKYYLYIAFIFMAICTYASLLNYKSLIMQSDVIKEFNANKFSDIGFSKIINANISFPNITVTAMPLRVFLARYYHLSNDNTKALELLNSPLADNPHLLTYETLKSRIYLSLGVQDSAEFYSKKAFYGLPGNAVNFELYVKSLLIKKDTAEIKKAFDNVSLKSNPQFWKIYLAAMLNLQSINDSILINQAQKAKSLFQSDPQIVGVSNFVIYGRENIEKSVVLNDSATTFFNSKDFIKAAILYSNASKLNPSDYTYFENAGISYFEAQSYEKSIPYFTHVIDSLNPSTGKSEFFLAKSLYNINKRDEACGYLKKSMKFNFKPAFAEFSKNCK